MDIKTWCEAERGRAVKLADSIGVSPSFLSQMAGGGRPIPAVYCIAIETATGGAVTRREMRPDDWYRIWPELEQTT